MCDGMNQAAVNMTADIKQDCAHAPQKLTGRRMTVAGQLGSGALSRA